MKINGYVQLRGRLEDGQEEGVVQEQPVCVAIEENAMKSELGDAALKLKRRALGVLQPESSKAAEAFRMGRTASVGSSLISRQSEMAVPASSDSIPMAASESTGWSMAA